MGPLPRTANGKLYILVAIDYMTRWVETQSVAKVNEKTVSKFVYTHICCRFGTPLEIVSDNGPGFRRGLLTEICEELKVSHRHSTPYYPQSNGLVEKANGIIARIIRKMVESKPKRWDNFLDGAIWAYKTTYRDATQFTPFHLVYGQEALQLIELNIPTIKLTGRQEQNNDEAWIDRLLNLVEIEWKREAAYHCYKKKALQLKEKLNEGIKDKEIKEKSLVLRHNNALDNRFNAKFEHRWEGPFIVKKAFTGGYYQLMDLNGKEHPRKVNGYRLKPYLSRILPAVFETKQISKKTKKLESILEAGSFELDTASWLSKPALFELFKSVLVPLMETYSFGWACVLGVLKWPEHVVSICRKKTMAVNESRRTLAGYLLFYGEPEEDADLFVADFKMALRINHIRDPVESLGLFEVTLRKSANTWFTALTPPLNQDFEQVLIAFRAQFGQARNPQKLWKEILLIRQRTLDDYLTYGQAFNTAWTIWLQSLPNSGDGVEFLKKEQFTAGLIPTLRLKVESGDPVTYHDAERRAYQKYRKLKCLEEEPLLVLRPREVPIQVSNIAPIPVVPLAAGPSTQPAMIDNEVLERLNKSLTNLSIHLAQGVGPRGTIPRSPQERPIRPRRVLTCWNCGEEGHGINNCPYPRGGYGQPPQQLLYPRNHANDPPPRGPVTILQRPNPPLAPIREEAPTPPLPGPGVHVVKVAFVRPPAYAEALANEIKQTRGKEKEDTMRKDSIPSGREHKREKGETSKRRRRRRINLHDFPLGHGMSPYNLIEDLQAKGPSISWPQFFALCPQVRREMAKAISTRIPKKKGNVVRIAPVEMEDIVPTIDCFIKGTLVRKGLVDSGAQICIMTEATMHRLNLKIHKTPEVRVKMADNSKAKCLGMMGAKQDWETGELICERAGKKIVYDMKENRHEEVSHESTTSESEEDLEDTTSSSEDLSSSSEEGSSVIDVMGIRISHCLALQRAKPRSEPRFQEGLLTRVCEKMKVKHQHATPYYPQSNGAVEKANGIITRILCKMVESQEKHWDRFLDGALWAYRTTYKCATGFTPFHLVYGQEALQPIELEIQTIRAIKNEGKTEEEILADECVKWVLLDNKRFLSVKTFEQQTMRRKALFDDKVKKKEILKGNLVLRYDNKLDTHFDKKFIPRWEGPFVVKKVYTTGYFQLMNIDGTPHKRKVNGFRLKLYLTRDVFLGSNQPEDQSTTTSSDSPGDGT
ncbi:hypothetical protein L7F22_028681 [Adiantum nelumboides]|nr:hypothetical protein [Adiantum nelumboides]